MKRLNSRGSAMIETAMMMPLLVLLLVGMTELARITYTYYTLQKTMYTLARYLSTQQGVNFCDDADSAIVAAKSFAINGTTDGSAQSTLANLTSDMIHVRIEKYDPSTQEVSECECSITGCDTGAGGGPPSFVVVTIPDGYSIRPAIPYLVSESILFKPHVRVPFGGA
ncbi:MAG TPA: TadE/TadG family type IV pilus assembly protein [Bryobacteraceae bacterium]|nr:TadE/TadG family type IV pilus assembly protein [Bryobacteraceae bacterium]